VDVVDTLGFEIYVLATWLQGMGIESQERSGEDE